MKAFSAIQILYFKPFNRVTTSFFYIPYTHMQTISEPLLIPTIYQSNATISILTGKAVQETTLLKEIITTHKNTL
jgi:hypothetical protein